MLSSLPLLLLLLLLLLAACRLEAELQELLAVRVIQRFWKLRSFKKCFYTYGEVIHSRLLLSICIDR